MASCPRGGWAHELQAASLTARLGHYRIKIMKEILFEDLKKGDEIKHSHMGSNPLVSGVIMESPRQGRGLKSTILVNVKGSEVGYFDEIGSIYSNQIAAVKRDGEWCRVDQKRLNPMTCFPNAMLANL